MDNLYSILPSIKKKFFLFYENYKIYKKILYKHKKFAFPLS